VPADRLTDELWDQDLPNTGRSVLQVYASPTPQDLGACAAAADDSCSTGDLAAAYQLHLDTHAFDLKRLRNP
jgi:hypothetical protein